MEDKLQIISVHTDEAPTALLEEDMEPANATLELNPAIRTTDFFKDKSIFDFAAQISKKNLNKN